jgi:hypothetical protein
MVDARDLKSLGRFSREGSSPSVRTNEIRHFQQNAQARWQERSR